MAFPEDFAPILRALPSRGRAIQGIDGLRPDGGKQLADHERVRRTPPRLSWVDHRRALALR